MTCFQKYLDTPSRILISMILLIYRNKSHNQHQNKCIQNSELSNLRIAHHRFEGRPPWTSRLPTTSNDEHFAFSPSSQTNDYHCHTTTGTLRTILPSKLLSNTNQLTN